MKTKWVFYLMCMLATALSALSAWASSPASNRVRYVTSVSEIKGASLYDDHQSVSVSPDAHGALLDLSAYPWSRRVGINAFAVLTNQLLFVPDADFEQDGNVYTRRDIVQFDPVTSVFTKFFDGLLAGIPAHVGLDALAFLPGLPGFAFSLDVPATLPVAGSVRQHDLLYWNGISFGVQKSGETDLNLPAAANVDALYIYTNIFTWYFSLDKPLGDGRERDVWMIPHIATNAFVLAVTNILSTPGVDLVGLDFPLDRDGEGLTDFEEYTGYDEPSTVWPGTTTPINPNGATTDPLLYDTDGDGFSDAEEAVAGTDPNDLDDYLRLLAINAYTDVDEVTWRSEAGRQYSVYSVNGGDGGLMDQDWQWLISLPGHPGQMTFTNIVIGVDEHHYQIRLDIAP